jgi:ABC-type lipoprotein export system ATPase subunit
MPPQLNTYPADIDLDTVHHETEGSVKAPLPQSYPGKHRNILVSMRDVIRVYDPGTAIEVTALNRVSLDIFEGEFLAITGQSGSGKSTLLQLLGLLDTQTSGGITFDGIEVSHLTERDRTEFRLHFISFVFQFFNLIDTYTALGNITFQLELQGMGSRRARAKGRDILSFLGLAEKEGNLPSALSGGEQQRVAIGRALAKDSRLILADEPTAHLDSRNADNIIHLLREVNRTFGRTIVIVTHEESQARQADRMVVLKDGMLEDLHTQA